MKKVSDVFKSIRFAKLDPHHDKGPKGSTDDEQHYTVGEKEFEQQLAHVKKRAMQEDAEQLKEGRPSQRHPLEGHEYHKKTNAELEYIAKDAHKAAEAMKGHNTDAENKYRDQANDSATVRYYRQKHGMADWYKKKYGHMNEEVEQLDELSPETLQNYKDKAKKSADELTAKGEHGKSLKRWTGHMKATGKQIDKTTANIRKALNREETEQIDEIIKQDVQQDAETMDKVSFLKKHGVTKSKAKELAQEDIEHLEEKNVPTSPEKWAQAKAQAKAKFDVYPSAYANGWAAKKYKEMGGGWKSVSEAKEDDLPFTPDKPKKTPVATAGKYGQGYSTAKHLAKMAMQKQAQKYKKPVKEESELSNKAKIIKRAAKKKVSDDTFQDQPVLSNSITKNY